MCTEGRKLSCSQGPRDALVNWCTTAWDKNSTGQTRGPGGLYRASMDGVVQQKEQSTRKKLSSTEDRGQTDRVSTSTRAELRHCHCSRPRHAARLAALSCSWRHYNKTYHYGRQLIFKSKSLPQPFTLTYTALILNPRRTMVITIYAY